MQKYKSSITSTTGAAIRNVPVEVLTESGVLADLFLDRAGMAPAPNPLTTGPDGTFYFYAVNGRYSLRTTVEGVTVTDSDVVLLQDPEEITVAGPIAEAIQRAESAAQRAEDAVEESGIPDLVESAQNAVEDANTAKAAALAAQSATELAKDSALQAVVDSNQNRIDAEQAKVDAELALATMQADLDGATTSAVAAATGIAVQAKNEAVSAQEAAENAQVAAEEAALQATNRVPWTGSDGVAILPACRVADLVIANLPATGLLVTQDTDSGFPMWFDRAAAQWRRLDPAGVAADLGIANAKIQALENSIDSTIIYPNGGSEAAPANVSISSRYVMANPFPGSFVMCEAQLLYSGAWGVAGWSISGANTAVGVLASCFQDTIVVQTANSALTNHPVWSGQPNAAIGANLTAPTPCRVIVRKLNGVTS